MQHFESRYVQRFNKRHGRVGHLFQGRFKSVIVEREAYLLELCRYIVLNPVRAGMVERPEEYRWSSYRAKIGLEKPPVWLCMDSLALFGSDAKTARQEYKAFVEAAIGVADDLMAKVVGQIVLGTAEFVATVQDLIDSEERSTEHPRFQREVGRPPLNAIMAAVAEKLDVTEEEIRTNRGALCRMVYARLGWWEGSSHVAGDCPGAGATQRRPCVESRETVPPRMRARSIPAPDLRRVHRARPPARSAAASALPRLTARSPPTDIQRFELRLSTGAGPVGLRPVQPIQPVMAPPAAMFTLPAATLHRPFGQIAGFSRDLR